MSSNYQPACHALKGPHKVGHTIQCARLEGGLIPSRDFCAPLEAGGWGLAFTGGGGGPIAKYGLTGGFESRGGSAAGRFGGGGCFFW